MTFSYTPTTLNTLERLISTKRLEKYYLAAGGDNQSAIELYTRNIALSSAFYGPLQGLEVCLRNSMHLALEASHGSNWYDNAISLNSKAKQSIGEAKSKLVGQRYPVDPPHMIAELSFGFWVSLLGRGGSGFNYEMDLWRPTLVKAFPHKPLSRKTVHNKLEHLRKLRNRIAHHEPIFQRHLEADYHSIIEVVKWICPETAKWINHHSRILTVLNTASSTTF